MKAGYARVSTKDQGVDLQVDALKKAGCTEVYTEVMSGTRAERPILSKLLENLRTGDVLVIWKLDRLGRSLKDLIEVVNELMTRKIDLKSLNDPIDTTTSQGQRTFKPSSAESTACAAETLYREGKLSSREIAGKLQISKSTLYSYLRHRRVPIGPYQVLDKRRPNRRNEHA
jgi:DNA invertase Pin-like site-specific DNA recombinase